MKNKILTIFMLIILFLNLATGFIGFASGYVEGSQTDYIEDFEDDTLGTQAHDDYYGEEWFYTENMSGTTYVDDTNAYGGTKSYRMTDNRQCLFTMNISDIYNISFWTKRTTALAGSWIHFQFNNATNHK